jgi:hypothetical protein
VPAIAVPVSPMRRLETMVVFITFKDVLEFCPADGITIKKTVFPAAQGCGESCAYFVLWNQRCWMVR